jgi:microcystin-dependent protein
VAQVEGRTAISIDELVEASIIDGRVEPDGTLIFTTRGGAEILGGHIPIYDPDHEHEPPPPPPPVDPLIGWPVGSVFMNETNVNPATLLGGGTWIAWGVGRMPIGVDPSDPDFDTAGETGGEKEHLLTSEEMPFHEHSAGTLTANNSGSSHDHAAGTLGVSMRSAAGSAAGAARGNSTIVGEIQVQNTTGTGGSSHTHDVEGSTGGVVGVNDLPHNNMPPYISVYMWKRTA